MVVVVGETTCVVPVAVCSAVGGWGLDAAIATGAAADIEEEALALGRLVVVIAGAGVRLCVGDKNKPGRPALVGMTGALARPVSSCGTLAGIPPAALA